MTPCKAKIGAERDGQAGGNFVEIALEARDEPAESGTLSGDSGFEEGVGAAIELRTASFVSGETFENVALEEPAQLAFAAAQGA